MSFLLEYPIFTNAKKKRFYNIASRMILENCHLKKCGGIFVNNHNFSKMVLAKPSIKYFFKSGFCQNHLWNYILKVSFTKRTVVASFSFTLTRFNSPSRPFLSSPIYIPHAPSSPFTAIPEPLRWWIESTWWSFY